MSAHPGTDGPEERGTVPETPTTHDPRVDEALGSVADLDDRPVDEHAERLGAAHAALQEVLRSPSAP